jgi:hypothetical protein
VAPPLIIIRENEIDELFDRFQCALQRVAAEAERPDREVRRTDRERPGLRRP